MIVTVELVRGNTLHVTAVFTDYLGAPVAPDSVTASFNYVSGMTRANQTFPMTYDVWTGQWTYDWDSSVASPGEVQWSVFTQKNMLPVYVADGCFQLDANAANAAAI